MYRQNSLALPPSPSYKRAFLRHPARHPPAAVAQPYRLPCWTSSASASSTITRHPREAAGWPARGYPAFWLAKSNSRSFVSGSRWAFLMGLYSGKGSNLQIGLAINYLASISALVLSVLEEPPLQDLFSARTLFSQVRRDAVALRWRCLFARRACPCG